MFKDPPTLELAMLRSCLKQMSGSIGSFLCADEESETQTGAVTTLKPHRNILYVKIKAVGNVKLITLEYILYVFMYNSYICKPLMQLSKYG